MIIEMSEGEKHWFEVPSSKTDVGVMMFDNESSFKISTQIVHPHMSVSFEMDKYIVCRATIKQDIRRLLIPVHVVERVIWLSLRNVSSGVEPGGI